MSEQKRSRSGRSVSKRVTTVRTELDRDRGVFMISVAAELADMHPQTLRMYEARGLITPKRSPKNTRLYSQEDVERLRRIQEMTAEQGLNLAGVETVLELEDKLEAMRAELRSMQKQAEAMERQMAAEIDRAKRELRAEIVPYQAYESEALSATADDDRIRAVPIRVERRRKA